MKDLIQPTIRNAKSLKEVRKPLVGLLKLLSQRPDARIGVVSGIIASDGSEFIDRNLKRMETYTAKLRGEQPFPVISAADIFTPELNEALTGADRTAADYLTFWRDIYASGFITDVFMTPGWERSVGATDEHETARKLGLRLHYVDELPFEDEE